VKIVALVLVQDRHQSPPQTGLPLCRAAPNLAVFAEFLVSLHRPAALARQGAHYLFQASTFVPCAHDAFKRLHFELFVLSSQPFELIGVICHSKKLRMLPATKHSEPIR
jgi:hypothetical protein